ncbi:MAG: carboxypeptidase regulatory-like domain-containing protein [Planctomycetales bacterium]|nr:carboxypeptidase regulatory-like domain-containing protein [Planctomycetales bacterium]
MRTRGVAALASGLAVAAFAAAGWIAARAQEPGAGGGRPAASGTVRGRVQVPAPTKKKARVSVRYPGERGAAQKTDQPTQFAAVVYIREKLPAPTPAPVGRMENKGLTFVPAVLAIQVGTTVEFPNRDDVYHNVLSYSSTKRFDLGRYPTDEKRSVTFDKPGVVRLACEIHEHMRGYIVVLETSRFAVTREDGTFEIPGVPAGRQRVAVWHEKLSEERVEELEVPAGGEATLSVNLAAEGG